MTTPVDAEAPDGLLDGAGRWPIAVAVARGRSDLLVEVADERCRARPRSGPSLAAASLPVRGVSVTARRRGRPRRGVPLLRAGLGHRRGSGHRLGPLHARRPTGPTGWAAASCAASRRPVAAAWCGRRSSTTGRPRRGAGAARRAGRARPPAPLTRSPVRLQQRHDRVARAPLHLREDAQDGRHEHRAVPAPPPRAGRHHPQLRGPQRPRSLQPAARAAGPPRPVQRPAHAASSGSEPGALLHPHAGLAAPQPGRGHDLGRATRRSASSATRGTSSSSFYYWRTRDEPEPPDFETWVRSTPGPQRLAAVHDRRPGRGRRGGPLRAPRGGPGARCSTASASTWRSTCRATRAATGRRRRTGVTFSPALDAWVAEHFAPRDRAHGVRAADTSMTILPTFSLASIARVGVGDVVERVAAVDHRRQLARLEQRAASRPRTAG